MQNQIDTIKDDIETGEEVIYNLGMGELLEISLLYDKELEKLEEELQKLTNNKNIITDEEEHNNESIW